MPEFVSPVIGATQARVDIADKEMQTLERAMNVRKDIAELPHIAAQTELTEAQAAQARVSMQREQQMLQIMAQGPQTGPDGKTRTETMLDRAAALFNAGFINEAMTIFKDVNQAKDADITANAKALEAQVALLKNKESQIKDMQTFLSAAVDPASYAIVKNLWTAQHPDMPIPPELREYNPQLLRALGEGMKSAHERTTEALQAARNAATDRHERVEEGIHSAELGVRQAQFNWRKNFDEMKWRDEKESGRKGPKAPKEASNKEVQRAQGMLNEGGFTDLPLSVSLSKDLGVSSAAFDMATEAKAMVSKNPALTMEQAMAQVFKRMKDKGILRKEGKPGTKVPLFGEIGSTEHSTYKPEEGEVPGATPPAQSSAKGGGKVVPFDPKVPPNTKDTYTLPDGSKWKWDGKAMKPVKE